MMIFCVRGRADCGFGGHVEARIRRRLACVWGAGECEHDWFYTQEKEVFPLLNRRRACRERERPFHRSVGRGNSAQRVRNSKDEELQTNDPSDAEEGYTEKKISVLMSASYMSIIRRVWEELPTAANVEKKSLIRELLLQRKGSIGRASEWDQLAEKSEGRRRNIWTSELK